MNPNRYPGTAETQKATGQAQSGPNVTRQDSGPFIRPVSGFEQPPADKRLHPVDMDDTGGINIIAIVGAIMALALAFGCGLIAGAACL